MIIVFNFFTQIYLERQRTWRHGKSLTYPSCAHRVQSQTSDFIVMLLSIIVIRLILKENNNASVTKIVHLKIRDITEEVLYMRNGRLNHNEL